MGRSRALTATERWELGLFLALLFTACLALAAAVAQHKLPKMLAWAMARPEQARQATVPAPSAAVEMRQVADAKEALAVKAAEKPSFEEIIIESPPAKVAPAKKAAAKPDVKFYNGKKYRYVKTLKLRVTAYAPDGVCCWPYDGTTTASGLSVKTNRGKLVAADTKVIPMHALVSVPGYHGGEAVPVLDRGGKIQGHRLDVLLPTFAQAKVWGAKLVDVKVYEAVKG